MQEKFARIVPISAVSIKTADMNMMTLFIFLHCEKNFLFQTEILKKKNPVTCLQKKDVKHHDISDR